MSREIENLYEIVQTLHKEKLETKFTTDSNDEDAKRLVDLANLFFNYEPKLEVCEYDDSHLQPLVEFAYYYHNHEYKKAVDSLENTLLRANIASRDVYKTIMFQLEQTLG